MADLDLDAIRERAEHCRRAYPAGGVILWDDVLALLDALAEQTKRAESAESGALSWAQAAAAAGQRKAHCCPVCGGTGFVSWPPWQAGDAPVSSASECKTYPCRACGNTGLVWAQDSADAVAVAIRERDDARKREQLMRDELRGVQRERDSFALQLAEETDEHTETSGKLADLCDILFSDDERAEVRGYEGVIERAREIMGELQERRAGRENGNVRKLYRRAIDLWGAEAQVGMLHEEIGELLVSVGHFRRGRLECAAVAEELADVLIMIEQMQVLFGVEDYVAKAYHAKLERLEQRIAKDAEAERAKD